MPVRPNLRTHITPRPLEGPALTVTHDRSTVSPMVASNLETACPLRPFSRRRTSSPSLEAHPTRVCRSHEGVDAPDLERAAHVVHVDACRCQRVHDLFGVHHVGVDSVCQRAMVLECRLVLRDGVDRLGADQVVGVELVGIARVLGRRRCPQRPLDPGAALRQSVPPLAGVGLARQPVGELGLGYTGLTAQRERLGRATRSVQCV